MAAPAADGRLCAGRHTLAGLERGRDAGRAARKRMAPSPDVADHDRDRPRGLCVGARSRTHVRGVWRRSVPRASEI
eukprot:3627369-Prymnesium_polylepis.1